MSKRAANTGWVCPECGLQFARIKQDHVCKIWSVEEFLCDVPPQSIILYERFVALVTTCGTFGYSVTKANICFRGTRRIFAGVQPDANGLHGFLDLTHQVNDRRFRIVSPYSKRLFVHIFHITSERQLDDEFAAWICEAYALGQGFYLN